METGERLKGNEPGINTVVYGKFAHHYLTPALSHNVSKLVVTTPLLHATRLPYRYAMLHQNAWNLTISFLVMCN